MARQRRKYPKAAIRAASRQATIATLSSFLNGMARTRQQREADKLRAQAEHRRAQEARLKWQKAIREDQRKQEAHRTAMELAALKAERERLQIEVLKNAKTPTGHPFKVCVTCNTHYPEYTQGNCQKCGQELVDTRINL